MQFPLGVFAIALATAVLPSLSRQAATEDIDGLRESFSYALKLVFFISIPAMIGLIILREPIVRLLFQRGSFDATTTRLTAEALFYYALGLWAFSGVRIVVATFYSLQDTTTPVKIAIVSLLLNILLSILLMKPMRHAGLALATSLSSGVNLVLLLAALRRRLGRICAYEVLLSIFKSVASATVMGSIIAVVWGWSAPICNQSTWYLLALIAGSVIAGCVVYATSASLFKCGELRPVLDMIKAGLGKRTGS